jgi:hypothetical protein
MSPAKNLFFCAKETDPAQDGSLSKCASVADSPQ